MKYYTIKRWTNTPGAKQSRNNADASSGDGNESLSMNFSEDKPGDTPGKWNRFFLAPLHFLMNEYSLSLRMASAIAIAIVLLTAFYVTLSLF